MSEVKLVVTVMEWLGSVSSSIWQQPENKFTHWSKRTTVDRDVCPGAPINTVNISQDELNPLS